MADESNRSDRDLLIRLDTKFESINENVNKMTVDITRMEAKVDTKFNDFNKRLDDVVRDIKAELKTDYVNKKDFDQLVQANRDLKTDLAKFTPLASFSPVEEVFKDISKRIRTCVITAGIALCMGAASLPTWWAIVKGPSVAQVQAPMAQTTPSRR